MLSARSSRSSGGGSGDRIVTKSTAPRISAGQSGSGMPRMLQTAAAGTCSARSATASNEPSSRSTAIRASTAVSTSSRSAAIVLGRNAGVVDRRMRVWSGASVKSIWPRNMFAAAPAPSQGGAPAPTGRMRTALSRKTWSTSAQRDTMIVGTAPGSSSSGASSRITRYAACRSAWNDGEAGSNTGAPVCVIASLRIGVTPWMASDVAVIRTIRLRRLIRPIPAHG